LFGKAFFIKSAFYTEGSHVLGIFDKREGAFAALDAFNTHMNGQITAKRVSLKTKFKVIYTASQKASEDNTALKYISDKMGELYAQPNTSTDATKAKTTDGAKAKTTDADKNPASDTPTT
jgi:hypothetical protein